MGSHEINNLMEVIINDEDEGEDVHSDFIRITIMYYYFFSLEYSHSLLHSLLHIAYLDKINIERERIILIIKYIKLLARSVLSYSV